MNCCPCSHDGDALSGLAPSAGSAAPTASLSTCHGSPYLPLNVLRPRPGHTQGVQGPARDSASRCLAAKSSVPMNTEQRCQAPAGSSEVQLTSRLPTAHHLNSADGWPQGHCSLRSRTGQGPGSGALELLAPTPTGHDTSQRAATRPHAHCSCRNPLPGAKHWRALHHPTGLHPKTQIQR